MSYKLSEKRLLPGGLNLLMPGDSPPQDESLDLTDWWPGAAGRLEQAPEPARLFPSLSASLDSVMKTGALTYSAGGGSLQLNGVGIDSGYGTAYPLGMIAFQGYAWFTSQSKQTKHNGSGAPTPWTIPVPAAPILTDGGQNQANIGGVFVPLSAGLMHVQYVYYITWVIPGLGESNPSPAAVITPAVDFSNVIIERPTPPATAAGWNVYREVPGGFDAGNGTPYLVNIYGSPLLIEATTYTDTGNVSQGGSVELSDTPLLNFGQIMEADHDPAPPAAIMANQTFNARILVGNSAAHPNRMWWTPPDEPGYFRGSGDDFDGDWVDVGTDSNDEIRAIVVRPNNMVVIYRAKSIWVHQGDVGDVNAVLQPACLDVGIAGARAVASTALGDYFVGTGGDAVYRFNNDWPIKLSQKIEPALRGLATENFMPEDTTKSSLCAVGHHRGRLYVSYTSTGLSSVYANVTFILHIESERWFACSQLYAAFQDTGDAFLAASTTGLWTVENAYGGTATHLTALAFQTQYQDCGMPDHEKTFADLVISANTRGQNLTVTVRQNKNGNPTNDSIVLPTLFNPVVTGPVATGKQIIPLLYPATYAVTALQNKPIRAFNLSVRITGAGATVAQGAPIVIDSPILLHYYQEARRGNLFDTGNTNHGLEGVGMIDQIELDIDSSSGPAKLVISSDIPGGVMTDRTSIGAFPLVIPQTTGRQVLLVQLASPVYGRLFRHQIGSDTDFQLYRYKVRILPIGVYLDGANPAGEFWYTGALSPGAV